MGGVEEEAARGASLFLLPAVLFRECFALGASVFRAPVNFRFLLFIVHCWWTRQLRVGRQSRYHICVGLWIIMWLHMKPSASHGGERPWAKGENLGHERRA